MFDTKTPEQMCEIFGAVIYHTLVEHFVKPDLKGKNNASWGSTLYSYTGLTTQPVPRYPAYYYPILMLKVHCGAVLEAEEETDLKSAYEYGLLTERDNSILKELILKPSIKIDDPTELSFLETLNDYFQHSGKPTDGDPTEFNVELLLALVNNADLRKKLFPGLDVTLLCDIDKGYYDDLVDLALLPTLSKLLPKTKTDKPEF
jgi:hypothetical protein